MGIYISGVKGLPEQVQENKNKIKEVEEQIEGIDFEAVRQLQGQVAENTQDINNLEASIGVQNQAINGLKDRADALESKTQLITYNSDYGMTDFRNSIEVADDVYASSVRVQGDGSIVNTSQSGMHFKEGANDDTLTIANNDGATPHYLHFNGDGTLDIDGNPVGGGTTLYNHNVRLDLTNYSSHINLSIINSSGTSYTGGSLVQWFNTKGFTSKNLAMSIDGIFYYAAKNYKLESIYYNGSGFIVYAFDISSSSYMNITAVFDKDQVISIE